MKCDQPESARVEETWRTSRQRLSFHRQSPTIKLLRGRNHRQQIHTHITASPWNHVRHNFFPLFILSSTFSDTKSNPGSADYHRLTPQWIYSQIFDPTQRTCRQTGTHNHSIHFSGLSSFMNLVNWTMDEFCWSGNLVFMVLGDGRRWGSRMSGKSKCVNTILSDCLCSITVAKDANTTLCDLAEVLNMSAYSTPT